MMAERMRPLRAFQTGAPGSVRALLGRVLRESPALLALGSLTAIVQSALLIPIALLVRHLFDREIPARHTGSIVISGVLILLLYATAAALGYVARVVALHQAAHVVSRLRVDLLTRLHALPQRWHDRQRMASLLSIAAQDTERIETMLASLAGNLVPALVVGTALIVAVIVISPVLFATCLIVIPPLMLAGWLLARRARARGREWAVSAAHYSAFAQFLLRALVTTRVAGGEPWALARASERAFELSERFRQMGMASALLAATEAAIAAAAGSAVLVVGGIAVAHGTMTLGSLLAFYAALGLLIRSLHSVGQSNALVVGLQSWRDLSAVLTVDEAEPYARGGRALRFRGGVSLHGVSFSYGDARVLHDLELEIEPGEHLALVGPNGAGKSTVVNLLLGLYEPELGTVRADGTPYDELDVGSLRRQIGVVLQDPVLLPGTIRENIAYARPEVPDAIVRAAAEAATAADFVDDLPHAYGTQIGDEGTGLSAGQRQRIAIARALLGEPALLVLDEPSTYLDDVAVKTLMNRLMSLPQEPTVLLVTHDPAVYTYVDRMIEFRDGRIVSEARAGERVGAARA